MIKNDNNSDCFLRCFSTWHLLSSLFLLVNCLKVDWERKLRRVKKMFLCILKDYFCLTLIFRRFFHRFMIVNVDNHRSNNRWSLTLVNCKRLIKEVGDLRSLVDFFSCSPKFLEFFFINFLLDFNRSLSLIFFIVFNTKMFLFGNLSIFILFHFSMIILTQM